MYSFKLHYNDEPSPAGNSLISLFIEVDFEHDRMNDILSIEGFFDALESEGFQPMFTCACGNFGCSGYYIQVFHTENGLKLENAYSPLDTSKTIKKFQYDIDWEDLYIIGSDLVSKIEDIHNRNPNSQICCGTFGEDLAGKVSIYNDILTRIREKYD